LKTNKILAMIIVVLVILCGLFFIFTVSYHDSYEDKTAECNYLKQQVAEKSATICRQQAAMEYQSDLIHWQNNAYDSLHDDFLWVEENMLRMNDMISMLRDSCKYLQTKLEQNQAAYNVLSDNFTDFTNSFKEEKELLEENIAYLQQQIEFQNNKIAELRTWGRCLNSRSLWDDIWGINKCPAPE
jgi:predicted  nucleic acid-binding Zn-ribbon protein